MFPGGARADLKTWPEAKWKELILQLSKLGYQIDLTGGKADHPKLAHFSTATNLAGALSLRETAMHLKRCACVISVDTGIMHLAAALGCPVIGLHGPTSPNRWGALGENVISLTPNYKYTPCIQLGFESKCSENRCLKAISVDQVLDAFKTITNGVQHESDHTSGRERDPALATITQ